MKSIIVACLLGMAGSALAADTVGFYFDAAGTAHMAETSTPGEMVIGYLVMHDASHQESIGQWRAHVDMVALAGEDPTVNWQFPGNMYNIRTSPEFDVRTLDPLPWAEDFVLATAYIMVPDPDVEVEVLISAPRVIELFSAGNFPVRQPVYGYSNDYIQAPLTQTSGNSYLPVATINDDGIGVEWPPLTIHTLFGEGSNVVLGDRVYGAMRAILYNGWGIDDRTLEAVIEPRGSGTLLRQVLDMYNPWGPYHYGDSPDPAWVKIRAGDPNIFPAIMWYTYASTLGDNQEYGLDLVYGDQRHSLTRMVNVYPDACVVGGRFVWGEPVITNWEGEPFDLGWTPVGITRTLDVIIRNIKEEEIILDPLFTGSGSFTLEDALPESLAPGSYHTITVNFTPETPGIHEASISWGNEICETMNITGLGRVSSDTPVPGAEQTRLLPGYPNPFNPLTNIAYEVAVPGPSRLTIHDLQGRLVRTLINEDLPVGAGVKVWDGKDKAGRSVASGAYIVHFQAEGCQDSRRITLLK